jgi:uncharacterized membrane protein YkvA (DUF1232 family)
MLPNISGFSQHFSDSDFYRKLREINGTLLEYALLLYLIMTDDDTPVAVKLLITGALGYLIWPWDVIPDVIPFIGYSDDLAVLAGLLCSLDRYITPELRERAMHWRKNL